MHCAQTTKDTDTIYSEYYITAPCLSQILQKFGLHRSTPSFPNFATKWPTSCWFGRRRRSTANCDWMVRHSAMVKMERQLEESSLLSLFRMVPLLTPLQSLLLPKWGSQMHISGPTSQRVPPPDEYDRRYRQVVCCAGGSRMSQAMPPFAQLIWPLFLCTINNVSIL